MQVRRGRSAGDVAALTSRGRSNNATIVCGIPPNLEKDAWGAHPPDYKRMPRQPRCPMAPYFSIFLQGPRDRKNCAYGPASSVVELSSGSKVLWSLACLNGLPMQSRDGNESLEFKNVSVMCDNNEANAIVCSIPTDTNHMTTAQLSVAQRPRCTEAETPMFECSKSKIRRSAYYLHLNCPNTEQSPSPFCAQHALSGTRTKVVSISRSQIKQLKHHAPPWAYLNTKTVLVPRF